MTVTGLTSRDTTEKVAVVVTLNSPLSVVCTNTSLCCAAARQSWVLTSSQALADRSFNGHLARAIDDEPRG